MPYILKWHAGIIFLFFSYHMNVNRIILFLIFPLFCISCFVCVYMHHTYQYIRIQRPMQRCFRCICRSSFFQPVLSRGLGARNGSVHPICHGQFREGAKTALGLLAFEVTYRSSEAKSPAKGTSISSCVFGGALPLIFKPKYMNL